MPTKKIIVGTEFFEQNDLLNSHIHLANHDMEKSIATSTNTFEYQFLSGGGEMGHIIREFNWARTPLGGVEQWPHSLKTTLGLILHSAFPMFLFWGKELICFYNDAFRPSLGVDGKHPAIGKKGQEVWPEIWEFIGPLIGKVMTTGQPVWFEDQLVPFYRNGRMEDIYWTFSYSPAYGDDGQINGLFVTCTETTQKVKILKDLEDSNQRFQNLVSQATVGIVTLIGEDFFVEIVNDAYAKLIGRTARELIGRKLFDIIPEAKEYFSEIIDNVRESGKPFYLSEHPYFVYVNDQKKQGFLDLVYQPYRENNRIAGVMILCQDVTEQVNARKKIEESEERFRLMADHAPMLIWMVDENAVVTYANKALLNFVGVSAGTDVALQGGWENVVHPDDLANVYDAFRRGRSGQTEYEVEARLKNAETGNFEWFYFKAAPRFLPTGDFAGFIGSAVNIQQKKTLLFELENRVKARTLELNIANQALLQSNADLQQFAHVASHDLKEPVRKIQTFINRLREEANTNLPVKATAYIDKIMSSTNRMSSMIDGVLKYSTLSAAETRMELVDLNSIVESIETDLEIPIQKKCATIRRSGLPKIEGSTVLIYQMFYNLINNSLKFSKTDVPPIINIHAHQDNGFVNIQISDNGIGFDPRYSSKIFESFTRLNSKDDFEGTGLGLSLCKKIVQRHHGTIEASGEIDAGAMFNINLPLKQE